MIFTTIRPDGTPERRRHVPYRVERKGSDWYAYHAETGQKCGRFDSEAILHDNMRTMTEVTQ